MDAPTVAELTTHHGFRRLLSLLFFAAIVVLLDVWLAILLSDVISLWLLLLIHGSTGVIAAPILAERMGRLREPATDIRERHPAVVEMQLLAHVVAAFLLVIPGLVSDVLGAVVLLPGIRRIVAILVLRALGSTAEEIHALRVGLSSGDGSTVAAATEAEDDPGNQDDGAEEDVARQPEETPRPADELPESKTTGEE